MWMHMGEALHTEKRNFVIPLSQERIMSHLFLLARVSLGDLTKLHN